MKSKEEIEKLERAVIDAALKLVNTGHPLPSGIVEAARALKEAQSLVPSRAEMASRYVNLPNEQVLLDGKLLELHWIDCLDTLLDAVDAGDLRCSCVALDMRSELRGRGA